MKQINLLCCILWMSFSFQLYGQSIFPELDITQQEVEKHLRFLASDELQGRRTGELGNTIAARYIATQLEVAGVEQVEGTDSYFQDVPLREVTPIQKASLKWKKMTFMQGKELLMLLGKSSSLKANMVFANYGWVDEEKGIDDYEGLDVKGKIVVTIIGQADNQTPTGFFRSGPKKRVWAKERGAVGLIELFYQKQYWGFAKNYFARSRVELIPKEVKEEDFTYGWLNPGKTGFDKALKNGRSVKVTLQTGASKIASIDSKNVIGVIEGSDPELKKEYVLLTAHFDHVGTGENGGGAFTEQDSIFNGARDNGIGTVALISAAKALSKRRPKRSVIMLAVTGEEMGLLGSRYYSENPLIPLNETIYNLNCDGAGYNDTNLVTVIGWGRTGADEQIEKGVTAVGLQVKEDPAPEQGLFDRSDNVNFASKGIPAPTFSPGFTGFDSALMQYYHQVKDNPDSVDYAYLLKFCQAFAHTARLVADRATRPFWVAGDKYEEAGKELYQK